MEMILQRPLCCLLKLYHIKRVGDDTMSFLSNLLGGSKYKDAALKQPNKCYIQFEDMPLGPLEKQLDGNSARIETLKILNVQASKVRYLEGCFYYATDSEPVYYTISRIINDAPVLHTGYYMIDFSVLKGLMHLAGRQLSA